MSLMENRKVAIPIMILMILVALIFGSQRSLSALRQEAATVFLMGEAGDGIGIQNDLNERTVIAYNLVTVGRKYLNESDAQLQNVLTAITALQEADSPSVKYQANQQLNQAATDLYNELKKLNLSKVDAPYPDRLFDNFNSRNSTISHDPYNQIAAGFNQKLEVFPASVLSKLVFVSRLELYQ
jgi:hypothetical protein